MEKVRWYAPWPVVAVILVVSAATNLASRGQVSDPLACAERSTPPAGERPAGIGSCGTVTGPPRNLQVGILQSVVETMWRLSPTFRRQCLRVAAEPRLTVSLRAEVSQVSQSRSTARALTQIVRRDGAVVSADVVLLSASDVVELIAHELEHLIEQLDGVELRGYAAASTRSNGHPYESTRAIEVGRRVAREIVQAKTAGQGASK